MPRIFLPTWANSASATRPQAGWTRLLIPRGTPIRGISPTSTGSRTDRRTLHIPPYCRSWPVLKRSRLAKKPTKTSPASRMPKIPKPPNNNADKKRRWQPRSPKPTHNAEETDTAANQSQGAHQNEHPRSRPSKDSKEQPKKVKPCISPNGCTSRQVAKSRAARIEKR